MTTIRLSKHHGLGNDFLVWVDGDLNAGPALAQRWCDRRRGIGADGLLVANDVGPNSATMVLFNADGSRAEMSGNGIRCFVQGVFGSVQGQFDISTDAGRRTVAVETTADPLTVMASVSMGPVLPLPEPSGWAALQCADGRPVAHLSLGNPHSVVATDDVRAVDLASLGALVAHVNLEIVEAGPESNAITMRVHERGAGITEACGTGACATAFAAASWGLASPIGNEIVVHMDGGDATVRLHHPQPGEVTLIGPATMVGSINLPG